VTGTVVARVSGEPLTEAAVDAIVARIRNGPLAHALPAAGTAEGRNLRRWVVQILTATMLVDQEAAARGIGAPEPHPTGPAGPAGPVGLSMADALDSGGVAAVILATCPAARAVRSAVTAGVRVPDAQIADFYRRNLPRYTRPERRHVSRLGAGAAEPLGWFRRGELPAAADTAVFQATAGPVTGPVATPWGPWELRVDQVEAARVLEFAEVRDDIADELTDLARARAFSAWLARRQADAVRLMPGFEHPSDPRNPDATHRH
jgi:[acyl-carrier-protein] S-malonyltransferase